MSETRVPRWRRIIAIAAAAAALLALPLGAAPAFAAAPAPVAKYVALGDSYAAGQGAAAPLDSCLRTTLGYASQIDAVPRFNLLRLPACSGATIDQVSAQQLGQVNRGTTLVTITAGANDLNIGGVYAACAPDETSVACQQAVAAALAAIPTVGPKMAGLIGAVHARSPRATIVVTGYPEPFGAAAAAADPLSGLVNAATEALDAQLAAAVQAEAAAGVPAVFVPISFGAHAIGGGDVPWLGGDPTNPRMFFHPNALGYAAYRDAILAALA
jgi:lysophospholipase L1-like esterase